MGCALRVATTEVEVSQLSPRIVILMSDSPRDDREASAREYLEMFPVDEAEFVPISHLQEISSLDLSLQVDTVVATEHVLDGPSVSPGFAREALGILHTQYGSGVPAFNVVKRPEVAEQLEALGYPELPEMEDGTLFARLCLALGCDRADSTGDEVCPKDAQLISQKFLADAARVREPLPEHPIDCTLADGRRVHGTLKFSMLLQGCSDIFLWFYSGEFIAEEPQGPQQWASVEGMIRACESGIPEFTMRLKV